MLGSLLKGVFTRLFGTAAVKPRVLTGTTNGRSPAGGIASMLREAIARHETGDVGQAQQNYLRVLEIDPDHVQALYALGTIHGQAGNLAAAERCLRRVQALVPGHADACNALGNVLKLQQDWAAAADCYRRAVAINAQLAPALSNLGVCLRNEGRIYEALPYLERARAVAPEDPDVVLNHGLGLVDVGRGHEGEELLRRALERKPCMPEAHLALALQLLASGRFRDGWREYEWRMQTEGYERQRNYPYPQWQGQDLAAGALLVRAEQGLGDQIMFSSCLPEVMVRVKRCVVECDPRLNQIFARSFPQAAVCAVRAAGDPAWADQGVTPEFQVQIGSLPYVLGRDCDNFPAHYGYLRADTAKVAAWRERLAALGNGIKIGISWRGGTRNTRFFTRTMTLGDLLPLFCNDRVQAVSLQYGDCAGEIAALQRDHGVMLCHWQDAIDDHDETAALIEALDLVISVQTTVAHLAGALGKQTWVLLPAVSEWRYMQSGDTMPWYPSVRLFRQQQLFDWRRVVESVNVELLAKLDKKGGGGAGLNGVL